ncbi:hypothetical protein BKA69DRAFT_853726 [Paraphysoderma sedebokerense]|nr:hypothetical protein BKA69DRAFT_853726 [Paraphysoderma sedebokerense]
MGTSISSLLWSGGIGSNMYLCIFYISRPARTILWRDVHFEPPLPPPSRLPSSLPIRLSAPNQDSNKGNGLLFHPNAYGKSMQNPYMNPHLMMPMFSQNHPPSSNSKPPQSQINSSRPLLYPTAPYAMPSSYLPTSLAVPYNPALGYKGYYPGFNTNPYGYNGVGGMYPYPMQYMKSANPPPQGGHPNTDGTNLPRIAPKPPTSMTSTMPESTRNSVNPVPTDTGAMRSTSVSNSSTDADTAKSATASSSTVQTSTSSHSAFAALLASQPPSSSSSHTRNSVETSKSVTNPVAVPEYGFTFPKYDVPKLRNLPQTQSTKPSSTSDKSTNPTPASVPPPPHISIPPIPTSGSTQLPYPMPTSTYYYPYMSMLPYHQQQEAIERLGIGKRQRNTIVGRDARKPKKPRTQDPPNPTTTSSADVHITPQITENSRVDTCQNGAEESANTEPSGQTIEPDQQGRHVERPIVIDNDYDYEGQMGRGKRARNRAGQNAYGNDAFEFYSP